MNKPKILFICTHNSARSQIAEGLLKHIYGEKYEVFSAGLNPTKVNPLAIKAMAEIGADISTQYSKGLEEFAETDIDLAVSVCQSSAKILCALCSSPMVMGRPRVINEKLHKMKHYVVHGFDDPAEVTGTEEEKMAVFRRVREEMSGWILEQFADVKKLIEETEK
jgi:arsenate reductase